MEIKEVKDFIGSLDIAALFKPEDVMSVDFYDKSMHVSDVRDINGEIHYETRGCDTYPIKASVVVDGWKLYSIHRLQPK